MKPAPTGREIEVYGGPSNRRPPRPYRGPDDHPGSPAATGRYPDAKIAAASAYFSDPKYAPKEGSPAATGEDRDWALHIFNRCKHSTASSHDIINDLAAERAAARAQGVREGINRLLTEDFKGSVQSAIGKDYKHRFFGEGNFGDRRPLSETAAEAVIEVIRALAAPETQDMSTDQPRPWWRHKKRGSVYLEIGTAQLQSAGPILEPTTLVIYCAEDGTLWARPVDEFMDGRFELLEPL